METVNKKDIKLKMQGLYNRFIKLSDTCFENSKETCFSPEVKQLWHGKAETYEFCANVLDHALSFLGVFINSGTTSRQVPMGEKRREQCAENAELDETELICHEI